MAYIISANGKIIQSINTIRCDDLYFDESYLKMLIDVHSPLSKAQAQFKHLLTKLMIYKTLKKNEV